MTLISNSISETRDCRHILHIKTLRIDCLLLPPLSVRHCSPREPTKIMRIVEVTIQSVGVSLRACKSGTIRGLRDWRADVGLGPDIGTVPTRSGRLAPMIVCSCAVHKNCTAPGLEKRGISHSDVRRIFHKQFATFSTLPPLADVSQTCYSQADCTGDVVEAPGPTVKDCCVGTNDGQSFADSNGTCIEDQCVGKRICFHIYIATIIIMLSLFHYHRSTN